MPRPPFPADAPGPSDYDLARSAAVAKIAERACNPSETEREARNRISHLISYAVKRGKLAKSSHGFFVFGDLATWARNKWPGKFDDWPCTPFVKPTNIAIGTSIGSPVILPGSLKRSHDMILDMHEKLARLEKSLQAAQLEIERLRPDAEKWCKNREKNRENASNPRK